MSSHQLNSKTNGPVLLFKTLFRHWNSFLSSVAMDGKDGYGLKHEKVEPMVSSLHNFFIVNAMPTKITKKIL